MNIQADPPFKHSNNNYTPNHIWAETWRNRQPDRWKEIIDRQLDRWVETWRNRQPDRWKEIIDRQLNRWVEKWRNRQPDRWKEIIDR